MKIVSEGGSDNRYNYLIVINSLTTDRPVTGEAGRKVACRNVILNIQSTNVRGVLWRLIALNSILLFQR